MKIHQLTADEALRSLQSGPEGLSADQAARRLVEFDYGELSADFTHGDVENSCVEGRRFA